MVINKILKTIFMSLVLVSCSSNSSSSIDTSSIETSSSESSEQNKILVTVTYKNPVFTKKEFPDPSIIRDDDGRYWAFSTEGDYAMSEDLVHWSYMGNILMTAGSPNWATNGAHLWAPDIQKIGDKYICYYSMSKWADPNPGIGYAYCEDLEEGNWKDGGKLFLSSEIGVNNSIDPMVLEDDGKVYMYFGSFNGIYVIELESDGLSLKGGIDYAKENKIFLTWPYEGAYVIKREDYYYFFVSQGSCCNSLGSTYNVQVYRGESPVGPFVNHKGESSETASGFPVVKSSQTFVGPGHNAIAQDDEGNDFIVYHSYSTTYPSKRMLCIDRLDYGDVGWPSVDGFTPSSSEVEDGPKILMYE